LSAVKAALPQRAPQKMAVTAALFMMEPPCQVITGLVVRTTAAAAPRGTCAPSMAGSGCPWPSTTSSSPLKLPTVSGFSHAAARLRTTSQDRRFISLLCIVIYNTTHKFL
jgi:hypothetical protein